MSPQISVYVLNKQRVHQPLFQWLELRYYDALSPELRRTSAKASSEISQDTITIIARPTSERNWVREAAATHHACPVLA